MFEYTPMCLLAHEIEVIAGQEINYLFMDSLKSEVPSNCHMVLTDNEINETK